MDIFLSNLPKVELHAHLNGSLSTQSIRELGLKIYGDDSEKYFGMLRKLSQFSEGSTLEDCFQKFPFMHELTSTRKGLQLATEIVVRDFALENVIYLELRTTPKANENMNRREYLDTIIDAIQRTILEYNVVVKLLVSIDRSQSVQIAEDILNLAIEMKELYPHIVKGMDLSGNPSVGDFNCFKHILDKAKCNNLKLALHCAEVKNDREVQEMLNFGFDRCGHGTFLTEVQLEQCRKQNIVIECCLTSNIKCGTVKSYDTHHFGMVLQKNVKTVLCTDDSGIFGTTLTKEFAIACKTFELSKAKIYELCTNAVDACFADAMEKRELYSKVDRYFKQQC